MQVFQNRPLALGCALLTIVSALVYPLETVTKLLLLILSVIIGAVIVIDAIRRRTCGAACATSILCIVCICAALVGSLLFFDTDVKRYQEKDGKTVAVEGVVLDRIRVTPGESIFLIQSEELDGTNAKKKLLLRCEYLSSLQIGDRFRLTGTVVRPQKALGQREDLSVYSEGAIGILSCASHDDCSIFDEEYRSVRFKIANCNNQLSDRLRRNIGGEEGNLASALLLGNRDTLSSDTALAFRRSGVSHLLALSGLHISILIGFFELIFRKFYIPKKIRAILIPILAVGYLFLTGCAVSTLRAVLMLCVLYLAFLFGEAYDSITSIFTVLAFILLISPYAILDVSMWLSFLASLGILLFVPALAEFLRKLELYKYCSRFTRRCIWGCSTAIAVGLFANSMILIPSAIFFGSTSLFSVPFTLILSPFLSLILFVCALSLGFPWATPIHTLASFLLKGMERSVALCSRIPNGTVLLDGPIAILILILLFVALTVCAVCRIQKKRWLLLPIFLSAAVLFVGYADVLPKKNGVHVSYLTSAGENESVLISYGKTCTLVDISDGSLAEIPNILDELEELRCTELDTLILTHAHPKVTAYLNVLSSYILIRNIILPNPVSEEEAAIWGRIEQEAVSHGITVFYGNKAAPNVEILFMGRPASDTVEKPVWFALRIKETVLSYIGQGALESDLRSEAVHLLYSSDIAILGEHGRQAVTPAHLPRNLPCSLLIYSSYEVAAAYPPVDALKQTSVGSYRFFCK